MLKRKLNEEVVNTSEQGNEDFFVKIVVKIGERTIEQDLDDALSIPMFDKLSLPSIGQMLVENTKIHGRWNVLYNEAVCEYDILKTKYEVWIARKSSEYRKELAKVEKGRVTDKMVEDQIKCDPEYTRYNDDLAISKKHMKHIFAIANGLGEKGDKLTTIWSMMRWEADALGNDKILGNKKQFPYIKRNENKENFDLKVNDGWPT